MRPRDQQLASRIESGLSEYERRRNLLGLADSVAREVLIEQILESVHRVEYVRRLRQRDIGSFRADPSDPRFDPLKAALLHHQNGDLDEACWIVFLSVHFGKHSRGGWRYLREIYSGLGNTAYWNWMRVSTQVPLFREWLRSNLATLRRPGTPGGFGNHRKYQSLDGYSPTGTGSVVASYVQWILKSGSHERMFAEALNASEGNSKRAFDGLYRGMQRNVSGFGRLARFDFLAMLGKLNFAPIEPGITYLQDSTGPLRGARMLFGDNSLRAARLDQWLVDLDRELCVGMQVLEDSLCNWQKSPRAFKAFRG